MLRLYKNGQTSPPLHPIDAIDWQRLGWSETKEIKQDAIQTEAPQATEAITAPIVSNVEARYLELSEMPWREIKRLHEEGYKLGEYPGKDEAIAAILKHEGL